MDKTASDLYAVLGVARDAPAREIRRAYRRLARQHHPDLNGHPAGAEQFTTLAHAYEVLQDPARRARYDRTLQQPAPVLRAPTIPGSPDAPVVAGVRRGILELSRAEALHVARRPLALHGVEGSVIVLPAGTSHGDRITVSDGASTAFLTVRTHMET